MNNSKPLTKGEIIRLDKRYLWHPYTPMQQYIEGGSPLVIQRAQGSRFYDHDGKSYLDGNASWWTCLLGHQHPRLVSALVEQAKSLCHVPLAGMVHEPAARLAEALVREAPQGLARVFFSDNGSTAVEAAIKMALKFWGQNGRARKRKFVALEGAFHGETLGVTALSGVEVFRRPFEDVLMHAVHVPPGAHGYERAFEVVERLLVEQSDEVAALVIEPMILGAIGMRVYGAEYLRHVRRLTEQHDVLLIADEVFTGFGRTGPMWACEHAGITPDILCTAKGLSGGLLPFAATLSTQRVFEGFLGNASRAFHYGHTYCGNPLGARVALEVLEVYRDENVLERARDKAKKISQALLGLQGLPGVREVRSLGMMGAVELDADEPGYLEPIGWRIYQQALERGAYLRPLGNVTYTVPALNISDEDLDELLSIWVDSVRAALAG